MGVVLASRLRGPALGRAPNWSTAFPGGGRFADARLRGESHRPDPSARRGPNRGPERRPNLRPRRPCHTRSHHRHPKGTPRSFGPLVRPRDTTSTPAVTYANRESLSGPKNQEPRKTLSDPGPEDSHWPAHALAADCSGSSVVRPGAERRGSLREHFSLREGGESPLTVRVADGCCRRLRAGWDSPVLRPFGRFRGVSFGTRRPCGLGVAAPRRGPASPPFRTSPRAAPTRVERRNACARVPPLGVVVQLPVISVSRMTAASLPPNRVENTVMPANLYSGGASLSSRCMVPVRLVASRR